MLAGCGVLVGCAPGSGSGGGYGRRHYLPVLGRGLLTVRRFWSPDRRAGYVSTCSTCSTCRTRIPKPKGLPHLPGLSVRRARDLMAASPSVIRHSGGDAEAAGSELTSAAVVGTCPVQAGPARFMPPHTQHQDQVASGGSPAHWGAVRPHTTTCWPGSDSAQEEPANGSGHRTRHLPVRIQRVEPRSLERGPRLRPCRRRPWADARCHCRGACVADIQED
jgi:hypothetical protein